LVNIAGRHRGDGRSDRWLGHARTPKVLKISEGPSHRDFARLDRFKARGGLQVAQHRHA
jgi:hypothetical protein